MAGRYGNYWLLLFIFLQNAANDEIVVVQSWIWWLFLALGNDLYFIACCHHCYANMVTMTYDRSTLVINP